ncbi:unnamed protein product [Cladocopium goreaui]|uniref:Uncharacterized protein n=1 Tax=Cladocopium goreaui TaxID=2562237 RepID=A0A9P1DFG5_9DINO|nr:unnamed protein product [Cladocopium goreaui]
MLSRCLQLANFETASLDIKHWDPFTERRLCKRLRKPACNGNPLDLLSPAGMALLMAAILQGKDEKLVVAFGLVCSSFVMISRGSTHRHFFLPEGDLTAQSVKAGNCLAARTFLLMQLIAAKGGVWVLEQPSSSIVFRMKRFQELLGKQRVFKQSFWMRGFGSKTPKRTTIWSNSSAVRFFTTSKKARKVVGRKFADTYMDSKGRKRFKGNGNLQKSQEYPVGFGVRFAQTMKKLRKERSPLLRQCYAPQPEHILGIHVSPIKGFNDLWDDAKMEEVIRYLVGSYSLNLPECWHGCLPEYCL